FQWHRSRTGRGGVHRACRAGHPAEQWSRGGGHYDSTSHPPCLCFTELRRNFVSGRQKVLSALGARAIRLQVQGTRILANRHRPSPARSLRSWRENAKKMAPEWEAVVQHARSAGSAASFVGPVAVLDADLRLVGASPEFHDAFGTATDTLDTILSRLRTAMLE